jgi:hypothetical protein
MKIAEENYPKNFRFQNSEYIEHKVGPKTQGPKFQLSSPLEEEGL